MEEVDKRLAHFKQKPIIADILGRLHSGLPSDLTYHAYDHTEDVMQEALVFGMTDGLSEREEELLMVAAAYHDAGFLKSYVDNEVIAAQMAVEAMRQDGSYTEEEITIVERMILDTKLIFTTSGVRQISTVELSKYLLDADLGNLGRDDFFDKGEIYRQELGYDREPFLKFTFDLLNAHRWQTNAARQLRQQKKAENILLLKEMMHKISEEKSGVEGLHMSIDRLGFLAKLPLLLNSSMDMKRILTVAIEHLKEKLDGEAVTVFLLDDSAEHLTFWVLQGAQAGKLEGTKMPSRKGIVGWVIEQQEPVLVEDVLKDPRFFSAIDKEANFQTRNLMCVPLTVRGDCKLGAVQVLNKQGEGTFNQDDLSFLEQFAHQVALAVDNARLYEALEERSRKLERLDQRKNEMITVITHEFRTPLNLIGTSADLLTSGVLDNEETIRKMSDILANGVQRLNKLIAEIKNISLVSNERVDVQTTKVEIGNLIGEVVSQYQLAAANRSITIEFSKLAEVVNVSADPALIFVVLRNLVSNALRFTPDKGTVTVSYVRAAGLCQVKVEDTGIGINSAEFSTIFEKFYEVGDSLQHSSGEHEFRSGGLGLGLATVKAILDAHGTRIELASEQEKGSCFSFRLPIIE